MSHAAQLPSQSSAAAIGRASAPLWSVLLFTFINSYASGTMFSGLFFVLEKAYGFSALDNCLIGLVFGITYIIGAVGAGPITRALGQRGLSPRGLIVVLMILAAGLNLLPVLAWYGVEPAARSGMVWMMWLFSGLYSALCGVLWPVVESFLAGGRTAKQLRHAMGKFNVTWSSALVGSLLVLAMFAAEHKMAAFGLVALVHLLSIGVLMFWPARAGEHPHEQHETPPVYAQLLTVHRVLLPLTYVVLYAIGPLLPSITRQVGVSARWQEVVASVWLAARVVAFLTMGLWHGWHGQWSTPKVGMGLLLGGFAAAVLAPALAPAAADGVTNAIGVSLVGLSVFLAGLVAIGLGAAAIYSASLYYAMEVGSSGVDDGGTHEAMIGLGYTVGPICGILPLAAVNVGWLGIAAGTPVTVGLTSLVVAGGIAHAFRTARATTRQRPN